MTSYRSVHVTEPIIGGDTFAPEEIPLHRKKGYLCTGIYAMY